jgi:hypothetical protein
MLTMDLNQALAKLTQLRQWYSGTVDKAARAAIGVNNSA